MLPILQGDVKSFTFNYKYSIYTENRQFLRVVLLPPELEEELDEPPEELRVLDTLELLV